MAWKTAGSPIVVSLLTQEHPPAQGGTPGRAQLPYVNSALKELMKWAEKEKVETLAITRLATGVGRLAWNEVKPMIESQFQTTKLKVFVYEEFHKGMKAEER